MKHESLYKIVQFISELYLTYSVTISFSYLILAGIALYALGKYIKRSRLIDYSYILNSPFAPGISLLAPAYNEELTIIDNVKSLLSIMYNNLEVIIVNDGSKDKTLQRLIDGFDLVRVDYHVQYNLKTKPVNQVYKSRNKAFKKLTVVDKRNGGKADALNSGINVSSKRLIACIDVDCIIERDALLKMVRPFMESNTPVIATGGVVRIANSCKIESGRLQEVHLPKQRIARFQTLEYMRAFLLGRMAWGKLNGLLLISGAFGMFRKDVVMAVGGYNTNTVGEDMELVVRMRAYMHEQKFPYRISYIPEPLCWTEAPSNYSILGRQRNRWTRGTFETLKIHKRMFLNPKYGIMGLISYPFWVFFEWLAPIIELSGLIFMSYLILTHQLNYLFALTMLFFVYSFSVLFSMTAILAEEFTYYQYRKKRDILQLALTALLEPILYHPRYVWWAIMGNWDLIKGKKSWGEMNRQGFMTSKKPAAA